VNVKHKLGHLTGSVEDADLVEDEAQTKKKKRNHQVQHNKKNQGPAVRLKVVLGGNYARVEMEAI
jgi:hypothetical protein